jgi:hypothetical protein
MVLGPLERDLLAVAAVHDVHVPERLGHERDDLDVLVDDEAERRELTRA